MEEEFVEDLDDELDDAPQPELPIEGLDEEEDANEPNEEQPLLIDGVEDGEGPAGTDEARARAAPSGTATPFGAPKRLAIWHLPPSLTPKKRGYNRSEVALDLDARAEADGAWWCTTCGASYESRVGLFAHTRFCVGRAAAWNCEWCGCSELATSNKATGPNGIKTLCSACGQRYRNGAEGPPTTNEKGEAVCGTCGRAFPTLGALGGHRRFCDGGAWRCNWCDCKYEDSNGKGPGPEGAQTLCSACAGRWRSGHAGPPTRDETGKYVCDTCGKGFDTRMGLGSHRKRCDGGNWRCGWCACKADECTGKSPGPDGKGTLCSTCSSRWRAGHTGPPEKDIHGRYPCDKCERTFETFSALGVHARNCDGGKWRCNWCNCTSDQTSGKSPGPDGPRTLCGACASRYRAGATGPPQRNEDGKYPCEKCGRLFDNTASLGGHGRFCDGGNWRCAWCDCKRDECSGKGPGPGGPKTLCGNCSSRFRGGHTGPPDRDADGRYPCDKCDKTFESFRALGIHSRNCDGGAWRCAWCSCKAEETSGKSPGPDGPGSLCSNCGGRYRSGAAGPAMMNEFGQYPCEMCGRLFETIHGLGSHRRRCNGLKGAPGGFVF